VVPLLQRFKNAFRLWNHPVCGFAAATPPNLAGTPARIRIVILSAVPDQLALIMLVSGPYGRIALIGVVLLDGP
jgi:hypothetical protein